MARYRIERRQGRKPRLQMNHPKRERGQVAEQKEGSDLGGTKTEIRDAHGALHLGADQRVDEPHQERDQPQACHREVGTGRYSKREKDD